MVNTKEVPGNVTTMSGVGPSNSVGGGTEEGIAAAGTPNSRKLLKDAPGLINTGQKISGAVSTDAKGGASGGPVVGGPQSGPDKLTGNFPFGNQVKNS